MRASVYWIDGARLAVMARPRAGDWLVDEIGDWRFQEIDIVISLLEPHEVIELELQNEAVLCAEHGIELISFAIPDRGVPASLRATGDLVRRAVGDLKEGRSVAVHCRAGIGRSALIAACILVADGCDVASAFQRIAAARHVDVPDTGEQRDWVRAFAEQLGVSG